MKPHGTSEPSHVGVLESRRILNNFISISWYFHTTPWHLIAVPFQSHGSLVTAMIFLLDAFMEAHMKPIEYA